MRRFQCVPYELVSEMLVLIASVESHSLNMHAQLSSGTRGLMFNLSLQLRTFVMCSSCDKTIGQVQKLHVLAHMFLCRTDHENTLNCQYIP